MAESRKWRINYFFTCHAWLVSMLWHSFVPSLSSVSSASSSEVSFFFFFYQARDFYTDWFRLTSEVSVCHLFLLAKIILFSDVPGVFIFFITEVMRGATLNIFQSLLQTSGIFGRFLIYIVFLSFTDVFIYNIILTSVSKSMWWNKLFIQVIN